MPEKQFVWPEITADTVTAVLHQLDESISIYDRSGVIERLETKLAQFMRVKFAVLVNSGTSAIHASFIAAGLTFGDEVIVPNYTFFATVSPIYQTGAVPVFVDCDSLGGLDPDQIEEKVTSRTRAIVATHMWGLPAQIDRIREIADEHGLILIEDISHAFGAMSKNRPVGSVGDIAVQSLQAQKPLTGGEGGVLYTNNPEFYYRTIAAAHYNKRCKNEIPEEHELHHFALTGMGLKWRIHPVAAAICEQQLNSFESIIAGRNMIAHHLIGALSQLDGLEVLGPRPADSSSWYSLIMKIDSNKTHGNDTFAIAHKLNEAGALEVDVPNSTRPLNTIALFRSPNSLFPHYGGPHSSVFESFPNSEAMATGLLKIPVWHNESGVATAEKYIELFERVWVAL